MGESTKDLQKLIKNHGFNPKDTFNVSIQKKQFFKFLCVSCNKVIKECHEIISYGQYKLYVHTECTKQSEFQRLVCGEWEGINRNTDYNEAVTTDKSW